MQLKSWLPYLWKIPVCGLAFVVGMMIGGSIATGIGLPAPALPAGADETTVFQLTLLGTLFLGLALAGLSQYLSGGFLVRWLILFFLSWVAYGVNTVLEGAIFSTMKTASTYTLIIYIPACLLLSAVTAGLFPPATPGPNFFEQTRRFFADRIVWDWVWRLAAAFLAFPIAYYIFGSLIAPLVLDYYRAGVGGLSLPGWDKILPVLFLRSLLFLLVCLPVIIAWQSSSRRLFVLLGLALFVFVGGVAMLQAHWFPPVIRIVHSLEMFADEMVYAAALALLLTQINVHAVSTRLVERRNT